LKSSCWGCSASPLTVLALSLLALNVSSPSHEKMENPDWWWGGWYEKRGSVTAAWYPKIWRKVVVSKYKDWEKVSRFGWLLRHLFYPVSERVGDTFLMGTIGVADALASVSKTLTKCL